MRALALFENIQSIAKKLFPRFSLTKKKLKIIGVILTVTLFLITLPEMTLNSFFRTEVKHKITSLINEIPLAVSFDGISYSTFSGIELYDFKISAEQDFSKGLVILEVPVIRFKLNLSDFILKRKITLSGIEIENATWDYRMKNKDAYHSILESFHSKEDISLSIVNSKFSYIIEEGNYEKEIWEFTGIDGEVISHDHKMQVSLRYDDPKLGSGRIFLKPGHCEKCKLYHGSYVVQLKEIPLAPLRWIFPSVNISGGPANIDINFENIPDKNYNIKAEGSITIDDAMISLSENNFYNIDFLEASGNFSVNSNGINGQFKGKYDDFSYLFSVDKTHKSIWPEKLILQLQAKNNSNKLRVPGGFIIENLDKATLQIVEPKGKKKNYRNITASLIVQSGRVMNVHHKEIDFLLKDTKLSIKDNIVAAKLKIEKGSSDISLSIDGEIRPYIRNVVTYVYPETGLKRKKKNIDIVAYKLAATGKLISDELRWLDFQPLITQLNRSWSNWVQVGITKGWSTSAVRERQWFQKYFMKTSFKMDLSIGQLSSPGNFQIPFNGKLNIDSSVLEFDLSDFKEENKVSYKWNAKQNYPSTSMDIKFHFNSRDNFSDLWLPEDVFSKYGNVNYEYSFSSSGERAADIVKNHRGEARIEAQNVIFNKSVRQKEEDKRFPLEWETLTMNIRRSGMRAWIYNIIGENQTYKFKGKATWGYGSSKSEWEFFPNLYLKKDQKESK